MFKALMGSFYNTLSLWIIWNSCLMMNLERKTKTLERTASITGSIICFKGVWDSWNRKAKEQWRVDSPVWREAMRKWEKMSMETWTYLRRPNWGMWVTSVCQRWLGRKPRGLIPYWGRTKKMVPSKYWFSPTWNRDNKEKNTMVLIFQIKTMNKDTTEDTQLYY